MLGTTFALAPAGVLGSGSADVRPYACAVGRPSLLPPVAVVDGTRVPAAGMARRRGEWEIAGFGIPAFGATALPTADQHDPISTNHGTTPLGIHPRGRSTS
jgi:hypothetical protein